MIKKIFVILLITTAVLSLTGCYSYVGLDEMTIVAGVAIDTAEEGVFELSVEAIDISKSSKDTGIKSSIIKTRGKTIFDAIRNARNQLPTKLYFGNNSLIIVSKKVAEEIGILTVIDFFIRDEECRETVHMVVSDKEKAADIIEAKQHLNNITSYGIQKIIENDVKYVGNINSMELYEIYNLLLEDKRQVCLPVITTKSEGEEQFVAINGMALFKKDKLAGVLDNEEAKYCLFVSDEKDGGIITLDNGDEGKYSLEIFENKTKLSFVPENGSVSFAVTTETDIFISEDEKNIMPFTTEDIEKIQRQAEQKIKQNIEKVIKKVQDDFSTDIYGYSALIYRKNPRLWKQLKDDWDTVFPQIQTKVECKVKVLSTSYLK